MVAAPPALSFHLGGKLLASYAKGSPLNQDEAARLRNQNEDLEQAGVKGAGLL